MPIKLMPLSQILVNEPELWGLSLRLFIVVKG